jgi:hypothetical protein
MVEDTWLSKGGLVEFYTNAWIFKGVERRYANPGVILRVKRNQRHPSAEVYWSDGKITTEHASYLRPAVEQTKN